MNKKIKIKICGIRDQISMNIACKLEVDYVGFVFYKNSPRNVSITDAKSLSQVKKANTKIVALVVNPSDDLLKTVNYNVKPDYIQLHGSETVERCFEIKKKTQLLTDIKKFKNIVDISLFDSPRGILPGGNGKKFDWNILKDFKFDFKWLLAGGINSNNVQKAIKTTNAKGIDISSGVELEKGMKSPQLIQNFIRRCRNI